MLNAGIRWIRLDAVAYTQKVVGTKCVQLEETHELVRLIRDLLEWRCPEAVLVTETNVPHEENISYFGQGDEAHMIYQFSLPPLLLHGLATGSAQYLTRWASELAPPAPGGGGVVMSKLSLSAADGVSEVRSPYGVGLIGHSLTTSASEMSANPFSSFIFVHSFFRANFGFILAIFRFLLGLQTQCF